MAACQYDMGGLYGYQTPRNRLETKFSPSNNLTGIYGIHRIRQGTVLGLAGAEKQSLLFCSRQIHYCSFLDYKPQYL